MKEEKLCPIIILLRVAAVKIGNWKWQNVEWKGSDILTLWPVYELRAEPCILGVRVLVDVDLQECQAVSVMPSSYRTSSRQAAKRYNLWVMQPLILRLKDSLLNFQKFLQEPPTPSQPLPSLLQNLQILVCVSCISFNEEKPLVRRDPLFFFLTVWVRFLKAVVDERKSFFSP